ncbi:MAG: SipW-dependent-type signal peptide-containing protein [Rhodococcus sp. (in: high G+C Gram-positive bacteria)]
MTDQNQKFNRKRKARALLAGGLVLGIGAAVTLAAWTDNVYGWSDFGTGDDTWNIQGDFSPTGTDAWEEAAVTPGSPFTFPAARFDLTPGDTVYAPIRLRLQPGQALNAAVTLNGAVPSPAAPPAPQGDPALQEALQYTVTQGGTSTACTAGTPTGSVIATGSLDTSSAPNAITLLADATPVPLCFAVTLPDGSPTTLSGLNTGRVVWEFEGVSVEPAP